MRRVAFTLVPIVFMIWLVGAFAVDQRHARLNAALAQAVNQENASQAEALLRQGADPNVRDWTTFYGGSGAPFRPPWYEKYLAKLMRRKPRTADRYVGPTVLMIAAFHGDKAIVQSLLNHNADMAMTGTRVEDDGVTRKRSPVSALFETLRSSDGSDLDSIQSGAPVSTALLLIQRGAPVNARDSGYTPLMLTDRKEVAAALIDKGADINAAADADAEDGAGETPLMIAIDTPYSIGEKHEDESDSQKDAMIRLLLSRGANINAMTKYGVTPLSAALESQCDNVAVLLLAHGADLNARDQNGDTPLISAARAGDGNCLRLLLAHGADVNAQNGKGQTALMLVSHVDYAGSEQHWRETRQTRLRLLRQFGADTRLKDKQGKTANDYFNPNPSNPPGS